MLHQSISQILQEKQDELANAIAERQFARQPDLDARYGDLAWPKTLQDTAYHLAYLAETIGAEQLTLFEDYLVWARSLLEAYGVEANDLVGNLQCAQEVLCERLPPQMCAIIETYIQQGLQKLEADLNLSQSFINEDAPHGALAAQYLDLLLEAKRHEATQLILDAVAGGAIVKDIYIHVFQPVQHEVGRLWQINRIGVAQEHYITAVTQLVMSQLYPYIFSGEKVGGRLVAASVGGELHEIGIRMVADFFEMAGWDTFYLGANTPTSSILETLKSRQADVLAVSATMTLHLGKVRQLIEAVRTSGPNGVKILVGGYPFNVSPDLWQQVGADGYAPDADTAIETARQLVGNGSV